MILVLGGVASGKRAYVRDLGYDDGDFSATLEGEASVLLDVQELVRDCASGIDCVTLAQRICARRKVAILTEVGSGIVPIEREERAWRDRVGQLGRELAARATTVVRMVCGIPVVLKGEAACGEGQAADADAPALREPTGLELVIMRHGTSTYNEQRRYAGWTDVPLSERGKREARAAGVCPHVPKVYVSPLLRARQTASICFPNAEQVVVDGLQEMNFGDFEGRTADEMEHDEAYRSWVEGMCAGRCPHGEGPDDMIVRMDRAVGEVVRMAQEAGERRAIIVAHGGTIMAALTGVTGDGSDYFGWQVGNCEGYRATVVDDGGHLRFFDRERFGDLAFLGAEKEGQAGSPSSDVAPNADARMPEQAEEGAGPTACEADAASASPAWQAPESFFQNRECRYFPCHEGVPEDEFNCLFCYCPLYALGPNCGGNFAYTEKGRKNCMGCVVPHVRDHGAKLVAARYELLAELARRP